MLEIDDKRRGILDAAITQFSQYGYRKTSMEDIAIAAGVSRPSLYSYFDNKEAIFRSLAQMLHQDAFHDAERVLLDNRDKEPVALRIESALLAFNAALYRRLHEAPHGDELMNEGNRLSGDIAHEFYNRFQALLERQIDYADSKDELNLKHTCTTSAQAAETIRYAAIGMKTGAPDSAGYERRLQQFIRVYLAGLA